MANIDWYYVNISGQQTGPVLLPQFKQAWDTGQMTGDSLCWSERMSDWTPVKVAVTTDSELHQTLYPPKPTPAPTPAPTRSTAPAQKLAGRGGTTTQPVASSKPTSNQTVASSKPVSTQTVASSKQTQTDEAAEFARQQAAYQEQARRQAEEKKRAEEETKRKKVEEEAARAKEHAAAAKAGAKKRETETWVELFTPEGIPYYYNRITNETTWDKPDALKEAHELDKSGEWVWMPDPEEAFLPAKKTATFFDGRIQLETEDGRTHTLKAGTVLEPLTWSQLRRLERDLVMLDVMNPPLIVHNLKERFMKNEIYTNVGTILISVNPYVRLPLYTPSTIDEYRTRGMKQLAPHVFVIADDAYTSLIEKSIGQSIVISGESGAGKTECTKHCLQYLAEVAGSQTNVEQKILLANPILEAFGNAKTVRNNNSSRFGKYVEIFFDLRNQISGAKTTNYLLEKSRVCFQQGDERNYHIFYQLCAGFDTASRDKYHIQDALKFSYLNQSGDVTINGVDDAEEFREVQVAMDKLNFTKEERNHIFQLVAGVLHLGNVQFKSAGEKKVTIEGKDAVKSAASLLQVPLDKLERVLTIRVLKMKGDKPIDVTLGLQEAISTRDALAKFVYAKLFDWLVVRINTAIGIGESKRGKSIGILDIFGFEIFKVNSFEQLCINYANEKLQQFFNAHTFKKEEMVYRQEQIDFKPVPYIDNQPVLDLIEKAPDGILSLVDEELRMPKGTDETFLKKMHTTHATTAPYKAVVSQPRNFIVKHYAGDVTYDSDGFLIKNKDKLIEDCYELVSVTSSMAFLKSLFPAGEDSQDDSKQRRKTLGSKFSIQLNELMSTLNATEPHYIRCVKPNPNKAQMEFRGPMVLEQLRYSGVFEAVEIRKRGFPFRYTHEDFYKRFKCILPKKKWTNAKQASIELVKEMKQHAEVRIGVSRVLYRAPEHKNMELMRNVAVEKTVIYLQRITRGWIARKLARRLKTLKPKLINAMQKRDLGLVEAALEEASGLPFPLKEWEDCKKLKYVLVEEKRVNDLLLALLKKDPEEVFEELSKAMASADELKLESEQAKKGKVVLETVIERRKTRKWLKEGVDDADEKKLEWAIAKAAELKLDAPGLIQAAKDMVTRIQKEKEVMDALTKAINVGAWLKDGDVPRPEGLDKILAEAKSFGMKTDEGRKLERLGIILSDLRKRLSSSIGTKDKALWKAAEKVVIKAGEEFKDHPEISAARELISHQAAVEEVAARLEQAVTELDQENLQYGLQQASQLSVDEHKYPIVPVAREYLERIISCRKLLNEAQNPPEEKNLIYAIRYAESFGYDTDEVKKTRELRDTVMQINVEAVYALTMLEEAELQDLHKRAEKINLNTADIEKIRTLLFNTPEEKFVQLQLKAAVKNEDPARITRVTIRLKDLFFKKASSMFEFQNYPKLRSATNWASLKLFALKRDQLAAGMRYWSRTPIHAPLTEINGKLAKIATRMFRNLMGYMGDRTYESPLILAEELLRTALENPGLRDEIYCQIIKQVTKNATKESEEKGWKMMALCLETFPPQSEFENYLEMYLRSSGEGKENYIKLLHAVVYGGPRSAPLTHDEILKVQNGETLRKQQFEKKKEYKRPVATLPAKAPIGPTPTRDSSPTTTARSVASPTEEEAMPPPPEEEAPPPPSEPPQSDWQVAYHPQTGAPYYYNTKTGEVTWDKPAEFS